MDMIKILGVSLLGTFLALVIKEQKPAFAILVGISTASAVFLLFVPKLSEILGEVRAFYQMLSGEDAEFSAILKITGVALFAKIGSDIFKDAGFLSVSNMVVLAGRVLCVFLALPSVAALFRLLLEILSFT